MTKKTSVPLMTQTATVRFGDIDRWLPFGFPDLCALAVCVYVSQVVCTLVDVQYVGLLSFLCV